VLNVNDRPVGGKGGGIATSGAVTLTGTTVTGNSTQSSPPQDPNAPLYDIFTGSGAGIYNTGTLVVQANSPISNNAIGYGTSGIDAGGGIMTDGMNVTVTISNSTLSGNSTGTEGGDGGAISTAYTQFAGQITIDHSTISDNRSADAAIWAMAPLTITNSAITNNQPWPDLAYNNSPTGGAILMG
jgi:hypothetical protein